ncbi:plantazolicin family TOMM peptide [Staphylococcus pseudintermedius]
MKTKKITLPKNLTSNFYGEEESLFEPMAARCTCTTIISSSSIIK